MKKLMVIMFIVAIALFVSQTGFAAGTAAGTIITNKAIVNGANFATQTNTSFRLLKDCLCVCLFRE
jgi:hypothetical protein